MPELPEVETTLRGIEPWVLGKVVDRVVVREHRLRWPVPKRLGREMAGQKVVGLSRRAKYLLLGTEAGTALLHLGMSGSLRIVRDGRPPERHDHVDLEFRDGHLLRLRDPRRFGCLLWTRQPERHPLLANLGPEPLSEQFNARSLRRRARGRKVAVKTFLMDAKIVVGIGNIYASEALFRARIDPRRAAGRVSAPRYVDLVDSVRDVLSEAIEAGGTTLRDFANSEGEAGGYFTRLEVYGREGEDCLHCDTPIRRAVLGQRSTFWCPSCQR